MKSLLLALGGTVLLLAVSWLNILMIIFLLYLGFILGIVPVLGAAYGLDEIRKWLKGHGISTGRFFLCAYVPSIVISGVILAFEKRPLYASKFPFGFIWFAAFVFAASANFIMLLCSSER